MWREPCDRGSHGARLYRGLPQVVQPRDPGIGQGAGVGAVASAGATADARSVMQWTRGTWPLLASFAGMTQIRFDVRGDISPFSVHCHGLPWWNPRPSHRSLVVGSEGPAGGRDARVFPS